MRSGRLLSVCGVRGVLRYKAFIKRGAVLFQVDRNDYRQNHTLYINAAKENYVYQHYENRNQENKRAISIL